jgi:hypothetical protein
MNRSVIKAFRNATRTEPTQEERILASLEAGNILTHKKAEFLFGCSRLAARVCRINQKIRPTGREIKSHNIMDAPARPGIPPKYHAEYYMGAVDG